MDMIRKYAEVWYQAFKDWKVKGERGRAPRPPVRVHSCPVCVLADVPIYRATLERFEQDERPDFEQYEKVLGSGVYWLKHHKQVCLAPQTGPQLVNCQVRTPLGFVDESHVAEIINRAAGTEHSKPLEALRAGRGLQTLVRPGGWVHPKQNALRAARAVLWLASELGDDTATMYLRQLEHEEVKA